MQRQLLVGVWRPPITKGVQSTLRRSFSRISRTHVLHCPLPPSPLLTQCRHISLRSIFSNKPFPKDLPSPTPSPYAVAHVRRLELDADEHPHDLQKQLLVFEGLSELGTESGWTSLAQRWDTMTETVRSSVPKMNTKLTAVH